MGSEMCIRDSVFTDCEICTGPISTNPGSMEAGEYGLTRVTCFLACRFELDAVSVWLWISWCVLGGGAGFFRFSFSDFFFLFERTRPAASMRPPLASYTSLLVMRQGRFLPLGQIKPLHTGVRTGCHYLVCRCVCVCHNSRFY